MALKVGELALVMGIDDKGLDKDAAKAGDRAGEKAGDGISKGVEKGGADGGEKLKKGLAIAGAAAGAAAALALGNAMDQRADTGVMAASLGLGPEQTTAAGKIAGKLYADNFGDSFQDVTGAVAGVMSSLPGLLDPAAIERVSGKVTNLAKAFEVDVARGSQVAGQMVKLGLAKDADQAIDLMTASLQRVPTALRENILDAVDEYGPYMQQLGITGEQAMGLLVDASEKGQYGIDKMGDALGEFTKKGLDMSETTGAAYRAIGLDQHAMTNELLAGGDRAKKAFAKVVKGLQSVKDPAAQSQAALALFGTPLEDLGTGDIPKFLDSLASMGAGMGDTTGAADRMGEQISKTANPLEALKRKGMQALTDIIVEKVIPAVQGLGKWMSDHKVIVIGVLAGITAGMVAWAASAAAAAIANFTLAGSTLAALAPFIAIGAAVAALVAGVIWAYQNWGWFRDIVDKVASFFKDTLWPILKKVGSFLGDAFSKYIEIVGAYFSWWWGVMKAVGSWISGTLWPIIKGIGQAFVDAGRWVWNTAQSIYKWILELVARVKNAVTGMWDRIVSGISTAYNWVVGFGTSIVDFARGLPGKVAGFFHGMWDGIKDAFRSALNWVIDRWNSLGFKLPTINLGPLGKVGGWEVGPKYGQGRIPRFHDGGIFTSGTGPFGEGLALLQNGEQVLTEEQRKGLGRAVTGNVTVTIPVTFAGPVAGRDGERWVTDTINRAAHKGMRIAAEAVRPV